MFRLDLANLVFTLHGHYGPITSIFIDQYQSCTGGSGSQDGLLCVWDLVTGACMYSIQAHDGAIVSLICSSSYVISMGTDERLYIWERFQGNLLNAINVPYVYTSLLMLTPSLLITAKPGTKIYTLLRERERNQISNYSFSFHFKLQVHWSFGMCEEVNLHVILNWIA